MLSEETFARGIQLINSVCSKQIETDDTMTVYFLSLSDLKDADYLEAIMSLIKTKENTYTPFSPAEIINKSKSLSKDKVKNLDIFNQLKLDAIKYGSFKKPKYKAYIEEALEAAGGWGKFCMTEEEQLIYFQREFLKELSISQNSSSNNVLENKVKQIEN